MLDGVRVSRSGGDGVWTQLNHPARGISLRSASAFLNSTLTTDHVSALQRVCSTTRRTRLMRSQGCQRRASVTPITSPARVGPRKVDRGSSLRYGTSKD